MYRMTKVFALITALLLAVMAGEAAGQPSQSKAIGVLKDDVDGFSAWLGRPIQYALTYTERYAWSVIVAPYFLDDSAGAWVKQQPDYRRLVASIPMVPDNPPADWRAQGAAGAYNTYFNQLAQNLVSHSLANVVIRLGWEMNGNWFFSYTGSSAQDVANWKAFWRQIVTTMRAVPGQQFQFDWNPNAEGSTSGLAFADFYPGDDVVDIIGLDRYDFYWGHPGASPQDRWDYLYTSFNGIRDFRDFAVAHHKPMSFPEWALLAPGTPNAGGGDDPLFIDNMAQFIQNNNVMYHIYFDVPDGGVGTTLEQNPLSSVRYIADFGHPPDSVPPARPKNLRIW